MDMNPVHTAVVSQYFPCFTSLGGAHFRVGVFAVEPSTFSAPLINTQCTHSLWGTFIIFGALVMKPSRRTDSLWGGCFSSWGWGASMHVSLENRHRSKLIPLKIGKNDLNMNPAELNQELEEWLHRTGMILGTWCDEAPQEGLSRRMEHQLIGWPTRRQKTE
eukprot:2102612-Amphidinium_carterae.1